MTTIRTKTVPPRATRMMEGLRDTGYDFNTAMADIIDNSIAANAKTIDVHIKMDLIGVISIYIADDGDGMNELALEDAMTYGSPARPDPKSLGKFGLGLKTASTAFCRCLSVSSKAAADEPIVKARWDLDFIVNEAKDWVLQYPDLDPFELELFSKVATNKSGTVVTWETVDRLIKDYADKTGSNARRALEKVENQLRDHVALVFQRFLDPEYKDVPNVYISINEVPVVAWDPFRKKHLGTIMAAKTDMPVVFKEEGIKSSFKINAYILPRKEEFETEEEYQAAKINNDLQGFYIYRENRLIHYGGWMGMFTKDPHLSLIRIEFSFDHTLDDAFNVDIKKSRIMLRGELYNWLKDSFLGAPRRVANERYRKGINTSVTKVAKGAHDASNKGISSHEQNVQMSKTHVKNPSTGEVELQNKGGRFTIKLPVMESAKDGEFYVKAVDSIDDGMLWEPCLIDQHHAIQINTKHPYYHKVYMPNISSSVTIQGMDSLLWALGEAELSNMNDKTQQDYKDLRYEVSRILRRLVEDLPEPELEDE